MRREGTYLRSSGTTGKLRCNRCNIGARGITLREWVLQRLGVPPEAIPQQGGVAQSVERRTHNPKVGGSIPPPATKLIRNPADVKRLVTGIRNGKKVTEELHISKACPSCGALNGMHFRGCKA